MQVKKVVVPAVTEVVVKVPEERTYTLTLDEDEVQVLVAYLGATVSDREVFDTYPMFIALSDAVGHNNRKYKIEHKTERAYLKVRKV